MPRTAQTSSRDNKPDWPLFFADQAQAVTDERLQHFYAAGAVAGTTPLTDVPFVALDFETTGLDPQQNSIVSVGLVPFDLQRIHCAQSRHWIVRPRHPLKADSVVIHGITHSDISDVPDLRSILDEFLAALAGRIAVVHYRAIERQFLHSALMTRLGEGIEFPVVDTMELEARLHRKPPNLWNRLRGHRPASIRLADSRNRYGLPHYPPHSALTDALATAELLQAQIAYHFTPNTPIKQLWL